LRQITDVRQFISLQDAFKPSPGRERVLDLPQQRGPALLYLPPRGLSLGFLIRQLSDNAFKL
jgi:hypothetical protein